MVVVMEMVEVTTAKATLAVVVAVAKATVATLAVVATATVATRTRVVVATRTRVVATVVEGVDNEMVDNEMVDNVVGVDVDAVATEAAIVSQIIRIILVIVVNLLCSYLLRVVQEPMQLKLPNMFVMVNHPFSWQQVQTALIKQQNHWHTHGSI